MEQIIETLIGILSTIGWTIGILAAIAVPILAIILMGQNDIILTSVERGYAKIVKDPGGNFVKYMGNIADHVVDKKTGDIIPIPKLEDAQVSSDALLAKQARRIPFFGYQIMGLNPFLRVHDANIEYYTSASGEKGTLGPVRKEIRTNLPHKENLNVVLRGMETRNDTENDGAIPIILIDLTLVISVELQSLKAYGILPDDSSGWTNVVTEMATAAAQEVLGGSTYNVIVLRQKPRKDPENKNETGEKELSIQILEKLNEKLISVYCEDPKKQKSPLTVVGVQITDPKLSDGNPEGVKKLFERLNTTRQALKLDHETAQNRLKIRELEAQGDAAKVAALVEKYKGDPKLAAMHMRAEMMAKAIEAAKPSVITVNNGNTDKGNGGPPVIINLGNKPKGSNNNTNRPPNQPDDDDEDDFSDSDSDTPSRN